MKTVVGLAVGAALGYGWYALVGCPGNTCPIVSNPWTSMIYGAAVGGMLAGG